MPGAEVEVSRSPQMRAQVPPLGERLGELRRKARRTCSEVSEAAGISRQHLWRIEQGIVLNPSPELLARLARSYGLTLGELLSEPIPATTRALSVSAEREVVLRRLMQCADTMCNDDWQALHELANRASARVEAVAR